MTVSTHEGNERCSVHTSLHPASLCKEWPTHTSRCYDAPGVGYQWTVQQVSAPSYSAVSSGTQLSTGPEQQGRGRETPQWVGHAAWETPSGQARPLQFASICLYLWVFSSTLSSISFLTLKESITTLETLTRKWELKKKMRMNLFQIQALQRNSETNF